MVFGVGKECLPYLMGHVNAVLSLQDRGKNIVV
jgi:hypothetical protein